MLQPTFNGADALVALDRFRLLQWPGRAEFGELFLTDVRIPAENMIGRENNGWRVAQATLGSERGVIAFEGAERQRYEIEAFYRKSLETGAAWLQDTQLRREFVSFLAEMQAGRRLLRRVLDDIRRDRDEAYRALSGREEAARRSPP